MKYPETPVFYERYAYFQGFGFGCMLVYWTGQTLEYVQFSQVDSFKREVISKELLLKYKKEMMETTND